MEEVLHLDWIDYAERLIGGGAIEWGSPAAVAGLINKAQALLPSDLIILPVGRMLVACASPVELAAKPRGAEPLRSLLGNVLTRGRIVETIQMIPAPALALGLPAPAELAVLAARKVGLAAPGIDEDLVDDASVYVAEFLRIFAGERIAGIVLTEGAEGSVFRALYAPIRKVAASYGWNYADGGQPWPDVRSIAIPVDGQPEAVLAQVRALRN